MDAIAVGIGIAIDLVSRAQVDKDRGIAGAGVSLGLERLCLALLGLDSLDHLLPFREI